MPQRRRPWIGRFRVATARVRASIDGVDGILETDGTMQLSTAHKVMFGVGGALGTMALAGGLGLLDGDRTTTQSKVYTGLAIAGGAGVAALGAGSLLLGGAPGTTAFAGLVGAVAVPGMGAALIGTGIIQNRRDLG